MPSCCQNCHLGYQNSRKILYNQMQHGFEMLNIDFVFCQCHPKSQNWHFYDLRSQTFSISLPFFFSLRMQSNSEIKLLPQKKGKRLHVTLEIPLICYSLELSKLYSLRSLSSAIYNGYQFLLQPCPSPILPLDWDLALQKLEVCQ